MNCGYALNHSAPDATPHGLRSSRRSATADERSRAAPRSASPPASSAHSTTPPAHRTRLPQPVEEGRRSARRWWSTSAAGARPNGFVIPRSMRVHATGRTYRMSVASAAPRTSLLRATDTAHRASGGAHSVAESPSSAAELFLGDSSLTEPSAAKAENDRPRSMKPPDVDAAINHARQAERAALWICVMCSGSGSRA